VPRSGRRPHVHPLSTISPFEDFTTVNASTRNRSRGTLSTNAHSLIRTQFYAAVNIAGSCHMITAFSLKLLNHQRTRKPYRERCTASSATVSKLSCFGTAWVKAHDFAMNRKFESMPYGVGTGASRFLILPLQESKRRWADAGVAITVSSQLASRLILQAFPGSVASTQTLIYAKIRNPRRLSLPWYAR
jgi:hypothetical protein